MLPLLAVSDIFWLGTYYGILQWHNMCLPHQQMACLHLTGKSLHTLRICTDDIFNDYYPVTVLNITKNKKMTYISSSILWNSLI